MATWPSGSKASTANLDAGSDKPSLARADIKQNVDNVNSIIDMFNISSPTNDQVLKYNTTNSRFELTTGGISDVVNDVTPQLGGDLDVNGQSIVSASNGDITIAPNGTGLVNIETNSVVLGSVGDIDIALTTVGEIPLIIDTNNGTTTGSITINAGANGDIEVTPNGTGTVILDGLNWPQTDGTSNQILKTDGAGNLSFVTVTQATGNELENVVEDTTPQLGGTLDGQGNTVSNVNLKDYKETNYALSYAATITPDVANGNVQTVTLTGNVTFSAFSNPETGQSLTLIVKQDATGSRTLTSTMKFAGAEKTLSTAANSIDIISVFYDGTDYYASLSKGFA